MNRDKDIPIAASRNCTHMRMVMIYRAVHERVDAVFPSNPDRRRLMTIPEKLFGRKVVSTHHQGVEIMMQAVR